MIILALDISSSMGWAAYDTDRHISAIVNGTIDLRNKGATGVETRMLMRREIDLQVCKLIDKLRPDVAFLEQPLNFIGETGGKPKRAPLLKAAGFEDEESGGKGGPNANTAFLLNQMFAVADTVCRHKCSAVYEVAPRTWQSITKQFHGDTKDRSIALCEQLGIELTPTTKKAKGDAADGCCIAIWGAGHCQELKLQRMAS